MSEPAVDKKDQNKEEPSSFMDLALSAHNNDGIVPDAVDKPVSDDPEPKDDNKDDKDDDAGKPRKKSLAEIAAEDDGFLPAALEADEGGDKPDGQGDGDDEKNQRVEEAPQDPELPRSASREAAAAFDKIKESRNGYREQVAEKDTKIKELEAQIQTANSVDPDLLETYKGQVETFKKKVEEAERERDKYREQVNLYDLSQDPDFQREFEAPLASLQSEAMALIQASEDPAQAQAFAAAALRAENDAEFYQGVAQAADLLPQYAQGQISGILRDIRQKIISREGALQNHKEKFNEYAATRARRNELVAKDYGSRVERIELELDAGEAALKRFKEQPEVQKILEPLKDRHDQFKDRALKVIEDQITKNGAVTDELTALALHGTRRLQEAAILRRVVIDHTTLQKEYDELSKEVEKLRGASDTSTRRSGGRESGGRQVEAGSLVDFARDQGFVTNT